MKIVNFRRIERDGPMVAVFDVEFKPMTVRGVALFQKSSGETWICEPSERYTRRDGQAAYQKHVIITDSELRKVIRREAVQCLESNPEQGGDIPF